MKLDTSYPERVLAEAEEKLTRELRGRPFNDRLMLEIRSYLAYRLHEGDWMLLGINFITKVTGSGTVDVHVRASVAPKVISP